MIGPELVDKPLSQAVVRAVAPTNDKKPCINKAVKWPRHHTAPAKIGCRGRVNDCDTGAFCHKCQRRV